jgi:hypothetical protein
MFDRTNPRRIYKQSIALTALDDLRVSCNDRHISLLRCGLHRLNYLPERFHRQSFFQDETRAEVEGTCVCHRFNELMHQLAAPTMSE